MVLCNAHIAVFLTLVVIHAQDVRAECLSCDPILEYCDRFENSCRSCDQLCRSGRQFSECADKCNAYLQDMLQGSTNLSRAEIQTIQILLGVITAVSLIILMLLITLVVLKCQRKKKQEKEVIPMSMFRASSPASIHPGSHRSTTQDSPPTLNGGRSMQTVTTQLSEVDSHNVLPRRAHMNGGLRGSHSSVSYRTPGRLPSEDCVPIEEQDNGYDNRGLVPSPTTPTSPGSGSALPPISRPSLSKTNKNLYTISHSQVV